MFYIQFVSNSDACDKLMCLPHSLNYTKQTAFDIARNWYGESVLNVWRDNEIDVNMQTIPFGSTVIFQEIDKEGTIKRTISYPQGKFTSDVFATCLNWFKMIDQLDEPENRNKNISRQIACHLEETREFLESLEPIDTDLGDIKGIILVLPLLEAVFKGETDRDEFDYSELSEEKRIEVLDSLCDMITTAIGVGYRMGFDMLGAMNEVNRSNWSKFENGKVLRDITGKVIKGKNYFEPSLKDFI